MIALAISCILNVTLGLLVATLPKRITNNLVVAFHFMTISVAMRTMISTLVMIVALCLHFLILNNEGHVLCLLDLSPCHILVLFLFDNYRVYSTQRWKGFHLEYLQIKPSQKHNLPIPLETGSILLFSFLQKKNLCESSSTWWNFRATLRLSHMPFNFE